MQGSVGDPCQASDGEVCVSVLPSSWCCNLEVHHCVCNAEGTADMIRKICSAYPNDGINCETCKAAPSCGL